jgi:hypothetical protein
MQAIAVTQATTVMPATPNIKDDSNIMTAHNSRNACNSRNESNNRIANTVWTPSKKQGCLQKQLSLQQHGGRPTAAETKIHYSVNSRRETCNKNDARNSRD